MSIHPFAPDDAAVADTAPNPAILRAERRLRLLAELAEIGMELARALKPSPTSEDAAPAAAELPGRRREPAEAFAGLSRAVRLTLAQEATADEALRDLIAGVATVREEKRARAATEACEAADQAREEREELIQDIVGEAAGEQITREADRERFDREFIYQLDEDEDFWNDPARPLREIVERYCDHFALTPDWSRWRGDHWAPPPSPPWPWAARSEAPRAPPPTEPIHLAHAHEAPARGPP